MPDFCCAPALLAVTLLAAACASDPARSSEADAGSPRWDPAQDLYFGIVGDTRPASIDDTAGYPTEVVRGIFRGLADAAPPFVVATGDYQFASTHGEESGRQLSLFAAARGAYPGLLLPAMGNHECTGATASNCGPGNRDGTPPNYTEFLDVLLAPAGQARPYYAVRVDGDGWTAKLVFVAANAWDASQEAWLAAVLGDPTTYTFVVRHEGAEATTAPGTSPSEALMAGHPLTLVITGHSHTYGRAGNRVTFGNGGAPLSGSRGFGYGLVRRVPGGAIAVDAIDLASGLADASFHFRVDANGGAVP